MAFLKKLKKNVTSISAFQKNVNEIQTEKKK